MGQGEGFQVGVGGPLNYERHIGLLLGPSSEILVHDAAPAPGDRALDAACGTGFVARRLLPLTAPGGRVIGIDINESMLDVARRYSPPGIEWQAGDLQKLPLADASVDIVVCQQGLQYTTSPSQALAELHRVLSPGGRLVASVWATEGASPYHEAQGAAVEHYFGPDVALERRRAFSLDDGEALRSLTEAAGFSTVDVRPVRIETRLPRIETFVAQHVSATPRGPDFAALSVPEQSDLESRVRTALSEYLDGDDAVVPFVHLVVTATA